MTMRIMLFGVVVAPAIAFSTAALALSESNCRTACALIAGRELTGACIERVPCAKYRGQPEISAAAVRRFAAAYNAGKRRTASASDRSIRVKCLRQAGARRGPRGWLYRERQVPAIDACVTAARSGNRKGQ
jgi:hypothetical protein